MSFDIRHDPPVTAPRGLRLREVFAVALMLGAVLFLFVPPRLFLSIAVWMLGALLLWVSDVWAPGEKALGTLVWPGGLIGPVVLSLTATQVCTYAGEGAGTTAQTMGEPTCTGFAFGPAVGVPVALVVFAAPMVVAALLLKRAAAR